jgi:hypothetical protein
VRQALRAESGLPQRFIRIDIPDSRQESLIEQ